MVLKNELSWNFIKFIPLFFIFTSKISFASDSDDQCAPRKFSEIVSKSNKATVLHPHSTYFYEPEIKAVSDYPSAFAFLDGKLYVDTRSGDLYSSKFRYDKKINGFRVERILYATHIEKQSILFPKYNQSCSEIESFVFVAGNDGHEKTKPVSVEYKKKKKCLTPIRPDSYGWTDC